MPSGGGTPDGMSKSCLTSFQLPSFWTELIIDFVLKNDNKNSLFVGVRNTMIVIAADNESFSSCWEAKVKIGLRQGRKTV